MPDPSGDRYCGCLYYSANALARTITRMAEEEFAVTGLAPSYAFILMAVNEKPGIQPKEVSGIMHLTPSTVTRLVEKLVAKGYVVRRAAGKGIELSPTRKARASYPRIREAWKNLYRRYSRILGEDVGRRLASEVYGATAKLESSPPK
ncbi:MAG: MarR family transcriptional regulator [Acidobacteria bacterium]|nr:MarR family transcriptional regulator [Acidobacteriota bacterium]